MRLQPMAFRGTIRWLAISSVLLAVAAAATPQRLTTFKNPEYGYTVEYPSDWHPQIHEGVFYIENFPPSQAVRAVRLPPGGAGIRILTASQIAKSRSRTRPTDLQALLDLDTSGQNVLRKRSFDIHNGHQTVSVIEVEMACCAPDMFREWAWYFQLDGRMFVAKLFCWQENLKTDGLRETLKDVVLHLRIDQ